MPDPGFTAPLTTSGFATNYIHGGARYEFGQQNVHPFLGLGVGATIFDPSKDGIGSSTNFSLSAEGGVRMMLGKGAQQRFGVRATFRGWFSFVPNGTYQAWCDYYYGCYATEGTSVVTQGEGSLGPGLHLLASRKAQPPGCGPGLRVRSCACDVSLRLMRSPPAPPARSMARRRLFRR